jgi:putative transposase
MYSYEDRLRAVRLYIKHGKRVAVTIRQLGYPTKNALKGWHRGEQRLDLPAGYVRVRKYSQAQRERAVEHYVEHGCCLSATIKALGDPSRALLPVWVQELHPETRTRMVGRFQELTPSMKQAAVIALCMRQGSARTGRVSAIAVQVEESLLSHDGSAPMKRQKPPSLRSERVELEQEIEALRRDSRRLQLEQDLLKNAKNCHHTRRSVRRSQTE